MRKRFLALVLAVCLVVGIMPPMADAVGDETMYKEPAVTSLTVSYIDEDGSAKTASLLPVGSAQAGLRAQPGSKMQFTVKFDTSERLAQVYITSTRDGDTQYLKANYDHQEDAYIADGYFDSSDSNYIPGTIGVSYSKKIVNVTSEDTILRSIDLAGWTNQLADLGITVTRSEVQGDAIASEVLLSMESTARKVALETAIKEFVDKEDMDQWLKVYTGLGEVDFDTKKGYDLFSSDAKENYSLYLDYGVNEFLTIVKDISGNKYTAMIFKKLDDTYDLEDLANTMSGLNSVASAFYDYNAITTEMNELRKDVSNNTSMDAEQKKEANDKIDELENDKKWFMMGTTFLPLIVSATVLTGGAAIPAAPALIFSAYLSAITATSDYFWDHRIGLIQGCEPVKNAFAVDNEHGGGWTPITNEWLEEEPNRAINESGKYYIAEDVQYGDNLFRNVIASLYPYDGTKHIDVTICLHGHKVGGISSGEGCNTTLLDCKYHRAADGSVSGGAITGFLANISNNGKLRVLNCILENGHMSNTLSSNDPEGGMLTFEGGTLKGACSISNGIGGIMTISGGEIVKDTAKLGAATITDGYYSTGANIANNKLVLPIEAAEGTPKDIGTITVTISSTNFEDITATIMVKSVDKIVPAGEPVLSAATITYGQSVSTIMMSGTLDDGAGEKVPGTFTWDKPDAVPNAGSYSAKWTFTPDNPALYTSATGSATITVNPASLAGAVITLDFTSYAFDNIPKTPTIVNVALGEVILTDTDYTANISSGTAAGTYTITVTGKGNYTGTAITTYRINPVSTALVRPQELPEDTDTNKSKVEIEGGISTVPAVIIGSRPELNTPAKLETAMRTEVTQVDTGIAQENTAIYDVKLKVSTDSGNTWQEAKKENFPADGRLTVTLPYPTGTDSTYIFTVVHMFTTSDFGKTPGDTEILPVTNTADGIKFTVRCISRCQFLERLSCPPPQIQWG